MKSTHTTIEDLPRLDEVSSYVYDHIENLYEIPTSELEDLVHDYIEMNYHKLTQAIDNCLQISIRL